ncbi:MAG: PAS domain-containing protein [Candidatus Bathyarchaeia archaeon]|jgi:PAS domain-containing protein
MENTEQDLKDSRQLLISGLYNQMRKVLDSSGQPVFIYLDDTHRACNERFAEFLGYESPQDWSSTEGFLDVFVDDEASRNAFMTAYWSAVNNMNAASVQLTWRRKDNSKVKSTMVIIPMIYNGQILSVHFIISVH